MQTGIKTRPRPVGKLLHPTSPRYGWQDQKRVNVRHLLKEAGDLTCEMLIGGLRVLALVDTGASVSLISSGAYRRHPVDLQLAQADKTELRLEGMAILPYKLGPS